MSVLTIVELETRVSFSRHCWLFSRLLSVAVLRTASGLFSKERRDLIMRCGLDEGLKGLKDATVSFSS